MCDNAYRFCLAGTPEKRNVLHHRMNVTGYFETPHHDQRFDVFHTGHYYNP